MTKKTNLEELKSKSVFKRTLCLGSVSLRFCLFIEHTLLLGCGSEFGISAPYCLRYWMHLSSIHSKTIWKRFKTMEIFTCAFASKKSKLFIASRLLINFRANKKTINFHIKIHGKFCLFFSINIFANHFKNSSSKRQHICSPWLVCFGANFGHFCFVFHVPPSYECMWKPVIISDNSQNESVKTNQVTCQNAFKYEHALVPAY